jgi:hypothetical protein
MLQFRVLGFILFFFVALLLPGTVAAHEGAKDGKISAFLHVDPDDKPKANAENLVHVYFNDQDGRFTMEGCDCHVKVTQGKLVRLDEPLAADDIKVGQFKVFLSQNNFSYDVVVSGTPKSAGFFQPFKLKFDIDAGTPVPEPQETGNGLKYLAGGLIILGLATVSSYSVITRRIKIKKEGDKHG